MTVFLMAIALMLGGAAQDAAPEGRWSGPCSGWKYGETLTSPEKFNENLIVSKFRMIRLITCVFHRWAPGNETRAVMEAERESGLNPWAVNPCNCYLGLYQHMASAWDDRARAMLWPNWFRRWPATWADPRANAIVAARMVARDGWDPWE